MLEQMQTGTGRAPAVRREMAETRLRGLCIVPGLGMGTARVVGDIFEASWESELIEEGEVQRELERIYAAFARARAEIEQAAQRVERQFSPALADIFRAHEIMLDSMRGSDQFREELEQSLVVAEVAVRRVFRRWQEKFLSMRDETFRQRTDDIADIGRKVLRHLEGNHACPFNDLPADSVLVFNRLLPSDVVPLTRHQVAAILVKSLGRGSHAALLARGKSIPVIANVPELLGHIRSGDAVLVDAYRGEIVVWPEAATRETFEEKLANWRSTQVLCQGLCKAPAHTADGRRVHVEANVGIAEDVQLAIENGADGVGLLRVEELYLTRDQPPTQEELFHELQAITAPLHDKPVTIRLLDVGSDKPLPFLRLPAEANRVLGLRGVRLLLEYPELTKIQLAAVLQLAQEQSIRVLIPMVTLEEDMEQFRELFEAVCADLGLRTSPLLGAMIETPAAALSLSDIARHADFLSVGTNDLTQYTLAADRDDPSVNRYYQDNHASVMRLLRLIINEAGNKPLTVCGELAGRDETLPDLMAMGYQSFSVSPSAIPTLKEVIRKTRLGPA